MFIIINFWSAWITIIYLKKEKLKLAIVISCYSFVVILGSLSFGMYYYNNLCLSDGAMKIINSKANDMGGAKLSIISLIKLFWIISKYAIGGFYNYPTGDNIRFVQVIQYFIGKASGLFLLGYIFNVMFNLSQGNKSPDNSTITL